MMRTKLIAALLLAFPVSAAFADGGNWSFAAKGGLLMEEKKPHVTADEGPLLGAEVTRRMGEKIDLGIEFGIAKSEQGSDLLPGVKFKFTDYFGKLCASYRLGGPLKGFYVGPQAALITRSLDNSPDDIGMNSFGYGARLGYSLPLGKFSLGAQADYLKAGKAEKTVKSGNTQVTYSVPETSFTSLQFSLRYHF